MGPGSYYIKYSAYDKAGNVRSGTTRTLTIRHR